MKKIFRNMAYALLGGLMLGACSAEEFSGANGELPDIVDYADKFNIAVDQKRIPLSSLRWNQWCYTGLGNRWSLFFRIQSLSTIARREHTM